MVKPFTENQELVADLVTCPLVMKQILDVIDIIASAEVRDKMSAQLKNIDFGIHLAARDLITQRAIEKAIALIDMKFDRVTPH
ncbi:MAG: DUF2766 family protein [Sodalis sp. (in: enterobacteria)]|uniref:DUF2766 family protein n=1 Tax=Sodalis sp. (in: enterobacteria) TaxID=1898979 RepID=UPI003F3EB8F8